jgi:two-component system OmpR family response regulator
MRVLVAEDDDRLRTLLDQALTEAGWEVETVADGTTAYTRALPGGVPYDVLLLDWMLPGLDGVTVCRRLREAGVPTPVLVLTARSQLPDRVSGLDAGADDYLTKPFELDELLARLRALHRRASQDTSRVVEVDGLRLDPAAHRVTRDGVEVALSAREFAILHLLMSRAGQVVSRFTILDEVWDGETDLRSNVIDVHVASLRTKIDKPWGSSTITTVRGVGYRVDGVGR